VSTARVVPSGAALWIVRHGETDWSASGRHTGRTDRPLTDAGERQALALRGLLADVRPVFVLSSPRLRALRTAELAGLSVDVIDPDAAEWDYGDYEGLTSPEIHRTDPDWTIWTGAVPGGEDLAQVQARADRVLSRVSPHLSAGPVVIVAHGHMNRVLAVQWLGLPGTTGANFALDTAAPCLLGEEHNVPAVVHWNIANPASRIG
jgi:broad specificity phosphatase PhoE